MKALNVFYYLTYEDAVDIDAIKDENEKISVVTQINNFGQVSVNQKKAYIKKKKSNNF